MLEYLRRGEAWWYRREDGSWLRWDEVAGTWVAQEGGPPVAPFRDPSRRRSWVLAFLGLGILLDAVAVAFGLMEYSLLSRIEVGGPFTVAEAEASDLRLAVMGVTQAVVYLIAGVFFIAWLHIVYSNLPSLGAEGLRFGRGWAIGAWFVPILHLWRPKQIVNDVWRGSDPAAPARQGTTWREGGVSSLLAWWWAGWVLMMLLYQVALRANVWLGDSTIDDLQEASAGWVVADTVSFITGILAFLVVRRTTDRQMRRARHVEQEAVAIA